MEINFNILSYIVYGIITIYIAVIVGYKFHKHGLIFIEILSQDQHTAKAINNILLVLYYCMNTGYVALQINTWPTLNSVVDTINVVGEKSGIIILILAAMHYINMGWIYLIFKFKKTQIIN